MRYEDFTGKDYEHYRSLFEKRGRKIKDGAVVILTDWAIENGLTVNPQATYIKVRNCRVANQILVLKKGAKQPTYYWAGFWKKKPLSLSRSKPPTSSARAGESTLIESSNRPEGQK